jgi:hypothetical protein
MHLVLDLPYCDHFPTITFPWTRSHTYPLILDGFEAKSKIYFGRLKRFKLWQLIINHPRVLWVNSSHGSHLFNSLYNSHVLHVSCYPHNPFVQLGPIPYPLCTPRSHFQLLPLVFFDSILIFKTFGVEMISTLGDHHLPLRSHLQKLFSFPFIYKIPKLYFTSLFWPPKYF